MRIRDIPFRIPDQWSAQWYRQHFVEVVARGDYANGTFLTTQDVDVIITQHNADPFAHADVINAHKAEANPHPQYSTGSGGGGNLDDALALVALL